MSENIRILIADDDQIIREGLANLLKLQNGLTVVDAVKNGLEVLRVLEKQTIDVVLLDLDMPILDGISTLKEIKRLYPEIVIVVLTSFTNEISLAESLENHVNGFLTKDISSSELAQLIKQSYDGKKVFGSRPTQILTETYLASKKNLTEYEHFHRKINQLPDYLRAVFDLLIQALPNKIIAKELGLSETTVRAYVSELFVATGYTNRGELTITAIKAGY
ncbi:MULTISPECIES: response regulator transcription factor [Gardnerella]|uniref:Two-component system response regulator n=1 Tax=Gardnerella vaginalis TaxID=2702 RepID=A0A3E1IRD1_GARVA|nr:MULTISPECIES: response regulator transcription factor [Gardnerella]EFH71275.1 response regulator (CheY receiver/winged-helix DNA-binding) [Gardnerella vaginalis 5-1]MDK8691506.1 response regulator transcription factor [Gardnerella swidsinskii]RFD75546.1 two-component system response regulator [Gardnerella vaginalis]